VECNANPRRGSKQVLALRNLTLLCTVQSTATMSSKDNAPPRPEKNTKPLNYKEQFEVRH
jgi:hypothetical protein